MPTGLCRSSNKEGGFGTKIRVFFFFAHSDLLEKRDGFHHHLSRRNFHGFSVPPLPSSEAAIYSIYACLSVCLCVCVCVCMSP